MTSHDHVMIMMYMQLRVHVQGGMEIPVAAQNKCPSPVLYAWRKTYRV